MANIRCLQDTHFIVLSKKDYNNIIGTIEKKMYLDKVNFLRNIPIFAKLTKTSLGKLTYYFNIKKCIRDHFLYKEGDPAEFVYIIRKGDFEITKKIIHTEQKEENI
jgi:hypothetical protein